MAQDLRLVHLQLSKGEYMKVIQFRSEATSTLVLRPSNSSLSHYYLRLCFSYRYHTYCCNRPSGYELTSLRRCADLRFNAREMHACGEYTPNYTPRYTPMRHTPMSCTPVRCTPVRCTPVRCMPVRCTPVRCTPVRYTLMRHTPSDTSP